MIDLYEIPEKKASKSWTNTLFLYGLIFAAFIAFRLQFLEYIFKQTIV